MSKRFPIACCAAIALASCTSADPFDGLAPARQTGGPRIVFDLTRKPFPEVPFPNDVLTRIDRSSPTGLRLNASLVAPSQVERDLRSRLDSLDGFGTFAPITVAFDVDINVDDLFARQNDPDPTNHAVRLVEIDSGKEWPLDFGIGSHAHFPVALVSPPGPYFFGDPFAEENNLLFPTRGPFANLLHPPDPAFPALHGNVAQADEDLLEFYERSTHTLILRPVLPLRERTRYAILLTNKLRDGEDRAVVPPGSGINHPGQTNELRPLLAHLPAGVQLPDIAYTWAFTTQTVVADLEAIANGLNARVGPPSLGILFGQFPIQVGAPELDPPGQYRTLMTLLPEHDPRPAGAVPGTNPRLPKDVLYRVTAAEVLSFLADPTVARVLGGATPALQQSFGYVDYFVSGTYLSPSFLDATDQPPQDTGFQANLGEGTVRAVGRQVPFFLAVPKQTTLHRPPFPAVIVGHEFGGNRVADTLALAGTFAKFGLASISIDAFGHGIGVDPSTAAAMRAAGAARGMGAFVDAILTTRARDVNNDAVPDPGGEFFSAQLFHTRDVLRQSVADWFQLSKLLRSFDGTGIFYFFLNPANGDLVATRAGDFNGDGIPDVGGLPTFPNETDSGDGDPTAKPPVPPSIQYPKDSPNPGSDTFVFGQSLGGLLAGIMPALDPGIRAAVVASSGGGLTDIALRTSLPAIVNGVLLQMMGPFVVTCPYSAGLARCAPGEPDAQPTLVMVVNELNRERHVPIAPLALQPGDKLSVRNLAQAPQGTPCSGDPLQGCATAAADVNGNVRVAFTADAPVLSVPPPGTPVAVLAPGNALRIEISGSTNRTIDTFGFDSTLNGVTYRTGDPLVAPGRGYGRTRNTPEFRRLVQLAQTVLEPADPINYAPYWFQSQLAGPGNSRVRIDGSLTGPAPTLVVGTVGDPAIPVSSAIALARAAGIVEMNQPDPAYGIPIDQVLIEAGVVEGAARTQRFASSTFGPRADLAGHVRCDDPAGCNGPVLVDPSGYSCDAAGANCTDGFNAPRLNPPLQQQLLKPVKMPDGSTTFSGLLLPYLSPTGQHGFTSPQAGKAFDIDRYLANLIGRYFETKGAEVRFDRCQAAEPVGQTPECPWMAPPPP
ncbi:MAG: hypothetical protein ACJ78X_19580 [Myxococcales bacterium]